MHYNTFYMILQVIWYKMFEQKLVYTISRVSKIIYLLFLLIIMINTISKEQHIKVKLYTRYTFFFSMV